MTPAGGDGIALARSIARTGRPAGSEREEAARAECAAFLRSRGFEVSEQPFEYSAWVGRRLTPVIGAYLALLAFAGAVNLLSHGLPVDETLAFVAPLSGLMLVAAWVNARWSVLRYHRMRRRGANLVARRGVPGVWLVAHIDTKGQPVPLALRAAGVVLIGVGWLVTIGGWIAHALGTAGGSGAIVSGLILAGFGAVPLAMCVVTDRGTGALDNASGIATIFETVDRLGPDAEVGVLVTTAEELALAGARAWAEGEPAGIAINCDGVDDEGEIVCVVSRDPAGRLQRAIDEFRERGDARVRVRRTLPGVLFDSVALAQSGWETMTVARGTLRSLARVHTAKDTLAAWDGSGVAGTAAFIAAVAGTIVGGDDVDHPAKREGQQWSRT